MAAPIPDISHLILEAKEKFSQEFGFSEPHIAAYAPGRVNLIGEHTDYNDGFVLPMALPLVTVIIGRNNNSDVCRIITTVKEADNPKRIEFPIPSKQVLLPGQPKWANYVKGVIANFHNTNQICGFDAVITTSVPLGGGLSSSASLEVATYTFLEALTELPCKTPMNKVLSCQKAEHDFAGVPCGIMDQYISCLAQKGHALLIDCKSLESQDVTLTDDKIVLLITNSNVHHELVGGEYAARRRQCEEAARVLKKESLRQIKMEELQHHEKRMEKIIYKRARHVVSEIRRTEQAALAMRMNDMNWLGRLMNESHISLRDDYEVSCKELDELVDIAKSVKGVLGSRMTGGGFGGCTVTLVYRTSVDNLIETINKKYSGKATCYIAEPSSGAKPLHI